MRLKKAALCIVFIMIMNSLVSCGYVMLEATDISDYSVTFLKAREYCTSLVWKEEYDHNNNDNVLVPDYPEMLPKLCGNSEIVLYFAKCVEELPVGNSVQILVSTKYEKISDYNSEKQRISNIKLDNPVLINNDLFDDGAIISTASLMDICEYVICYDKDLTLTYVYLQSVKEEDVIFDSKYLPKGYCDYSKIEDLSYSIYHEVLHS